MNEDVNEDADEDVNEDADEEVNFLDENLSSIFYTRIKAPSSR